MTIILGILLTLFVFSFIVFFHELGHFLTARMTGMKVEDFGMGIPPRAKTLFTDKRGTLWTLNWLPIGGFVKIKGEDPLQKGGKDSDAFASKPWWARSMVLLAGVTMNFLLAYVLFVGIFLTGASPLAPNTIIRTDANSFFLPSFQKALDLGYVSQSGGLVLYAVTGSIAEKSGLEKEEILISLNGQAMSSYEGFRTQAEMNQAMNLEVKNNSGVVRTISVTPESGKIGVYVGYEGLTIDRNWSKKFSFGESLVLGGKELLALTELTWDALSDMLRKIIFPIIPEERAQALEMVSGPIGIGNMFVSVVAYSIPLSAIMVIIAMISFNLGFFNLLPLPALDGGRWVTTTIRAILSSFSSSHSYGADRIEQMIHGIGFLFLLFLSLLIAFVDIERFF